MPHSQSNNNEIKLNFASMMRGLYGRVARKVNVDPSYVSRVARGERRSDRIEASLERELKRIVALANGNQNGASNKHQKSARRSGRFRTGIIPRSGMNTKK